MKNIFERANKTINIFLKGEDIVALAEQYIKKTTGIIVPISIDLDEEEPSYYYYLYPDTKNLTEKEEKTLLEAGMGLEFDCLSEFTGGIMYQVFGSYSGVPSTIDGHTAITYPEEDFYKFLVSLENLYKLGDTDDIKITEIFTKARKTLDVFLDEQEISDLASEYIKMKSGVELTISIDLDEENEEVTDAYYLSPQTNNLTEKEEDILSEKGIDVDNLGSFTNDIMNVVFNSTVHSPKVIDGNLAITYTESEYEILQKHLERL